MGVWNNGWYVITKARLKLNWLTIMGLCNNSYVVAREIGKACLFTSVKILWGTIWLLLSTNKSWQTILVWLLRVYCSYVAKKDIFVGAAYCQTPVQSPDFRLGPRSWLCFPPVTTTTKTRRRTPTKISLKGVY